MKLLYPQFLFAFAVLAIPVIIHLFNFRKYKKTVFTNVSFLKSIQEKSNSKNRLKHILVLISRILAFSFLVLAFAMPFFSKEDVFNKSETNEVSIFVDNHQIYDVESADGSYLMANVLSAEAIVNYFNSNTRFQILDNNFEGKNQKFYSKTEALELLEEIKSTSNTRTISEIIKRQDNVYQNVESSKKFNFIISSFNKNLSDFENIVADENRKLYFIPINFEYQNNLYIDSCWFESPVRRLGVNEKLFFRVKNTSEEDVEKVNIRTFINDESKSPVSLSVKAKSESIGEINFQNLESGLFYGKITIEDYPISFDNNFYFSYNIADKINIIQIFENTENRFINTLFAKDELFEYQAMDVKKIDFGLFSKTDLIVINEISDLKGALVTELTDFVKSGGALFIVPPTEKLNLENFNSFATVFGFAPFLQIDETKVNLKDINYEHPLYTGVFDKQEKNLVLPAISKMYLSSNQKRGINNLLLTEKQNPFLEETQYSKGNVYLLYSSLNTADNSFPYHALFVPTVYNMAIFSKNKDKLYLQIGKDDEIVNKNTVNNSNNLNYTISSIDAKSQFIPEKRIINNQEVFLVHDQIINEGNYLLKLAEQPIKSIAFNFSRLLSNLDFYQTESLKEAISNYPELNIEVFESTTGKDNIEIKELVSDIFLWKYCLLLVLLFLLIEILLIRFLK
jgi:hypothetical protein